jgi:hypothetical protein
MSNQELLDKVMEIVAEMAALRRDMERLGKRVDDDYLSGEEWKRGEHSSEVESLASSPSEPPDEPPVDPPMSASDKRKKLKTKLQTLQRREQEKSALLAKVTRTLHPDEAVVWRQNEYGHWRIICKVCCKVYSKNGGIERHLLVAHQVQLNSPLAKYNYEFKCPEHLLVRPEPEGRQ